MWPPPPRGRLREQVAHLEASLVRERRERAAMEENLSQAYNEHIKLLVAQLREQGGGSAVDDVVQGFGSRLIKKLTK